MNSNPFFALSRFRTFAFLGLIFCFAACKHVPKQNYADMDKELAELCQQIDRHPDNAEYYYLRASYYYHHKQIEPALDDIRTAVKLNANDARFHVLFADLYFAQRETDQAEELLQKAIALDPNNNEARLKLSELYYLLGMYDDCNTALDEAVKLKNHNPKAYLIRARCLKEQGDTTGYLRMLQLVLDQDPKETQAYLELGLYYQQQHNPLGITYYQNALQVEPNNKNVNFNLAQFYNDLGDTERAIEQYKVLLNIDPDYMPALNNLGYIYLVKESRYDEAIAMFSRVIEIDSTFITAVVNRAIAFEEKKEYDYARQDYRYAQQLDPDCKPVINGLSRLDKIKKQP
ncbi:MAG: tetratricopeptide repeat protein [Bacteroidales bacterium]|nr:tetratricopeptide repeat protein [Bacteroidales bacterium]